MIEHDFQSGAGETHPLYLSVTRLLRSRRPSHGVTRRIWLLIASSALAAWNPVPRGRTNLAPDSRRRADGLAKLRDDVPEVEVETARLLVRTLWQVRRPRRPAVGLPAHRECSQL